MATFENGSYTTEEDANGDYVLKDPQGNIVQQWDDTNNDWDYNSNPITNASTVQSDEFHTVSGTTMSDIDSAIDSFDRVKLQQGVTYTGSTTITIDLSTNREIHVDARGTQLDGSGVVIQTSGANGFPDGGRLVWIGGSIKSDASAGSKCIEHTDAQHCIYDLHYLEDADYGFHLRNDSSFAETTTVIIDETNNVDNTMRVSGATTTGGTGTDSFKNAHIDIQGHVNDGGTVYYEENANTYDSKIQVSAFVNTNRTGLRLDGGKDGTRIYPSVEKAGGSAAGTGIVEGSDAGISGSPLIINPDLRNLSTEYNISSNITALEPSGATLLVDNPSFGGAASIQGFHMIAEKSTELLSTSAPSAPSDGARLFVDSGDGDLKVIFADGTTQEIATDGSGS